MVEVVRRRNGAVVLRAKRRMELVLYECLL